MELHSNTPVVLLVLLVSWLAARNDERPGFLIIDLRSNTRQGCRLRMVAGQVVEERVSAG